LVRVSGSRYVVGGLRLPNCKHVSFSLFCADRLPEVVYVAEERALREMATKVHPVSTLNPNAPLFVPAAYRVVEDFSSEWWNLVQTCPEFRDQWVRERLPALEAQEMFEADLDEIADLDEFLEYQDEMQEMEAAQESLHFDGDDGFVEDDLSLFNINQIRDLKLNPKPQAPWCKPLKHHDKIPYKVPNSTKKGAAYRIQQPRAVM